MPDSTRRVEYFYVTVSDRPGEGVRLLTALKESGVNLLAFSGFPAARRSQLDFVPENPAQFKEVVKKAGFKLVGPKRGFLIQGEDRTGALVEPLDKLSKAKINVTAMDAVCAGAGRYGAILWVPPAAFKRAAKLLGVE